MAVRVSGVGSYAGDMPDQPQSDPRPYDAVLLLSFGGPEKPEDVVPFLENVTRGRGIPRERLEEVGQHYFAFGGKSPINDQNRAFLAAMREDFDAHGLDLPIYWGNRNWVPYLTDTVRQMAADGVRRAVCFVTSAYASYSGCRQYLENLDAAVGEVERELGELGTAGSLSSAPRIDRLRHYFNHPGFVDAMVDSTLAALAELPEEARTAARLLFVTHSIPEAMNQGSGPHGGAYRRQHLSVMELISEQVRNETGHRYPCELVYCSRSGPPTQPWLEPDVGDRIGQLAEQGNGAGSAVVVVVPIGFVSDHMEVCYDLDTEAAAIAAEAKVTFVRAATAGLDPRFVGVVRELLLERACIERGEEVARPAAVSVLGPAWNICPAGCCPNLRAN